jgi:hypothetical protein
MSVRGFDPSEVLDARLCAAGFDRVADGQDLSWRKVIDDQFIQRIGLGCEKYGKKYSVTISLGVYVTEVEKFVATLLEEDVNPSDTVGGSFSQIRTEDRDSGWYIPMNEAGRLQFEDIAADVAEYGVALLDKYCDMRFLRGFCLKEMRAPGSSELGIDHAFCLPAILFLTSSFDECEESLRLAEARFLERFAAHEIPSRLPRHYRYFGRLRELLAAVKK